MGPISIRVRAAGVLAILLTTSIAWAEMPTGNTPQPSATDTSSHTNEPAKAKPKSKPATSHKQAKPAHATPHHKPSTKSHAP